TLVDAGAEKARVLCIAGHRGVQHRFVVGQDGGTHRTVPRAEAEADADGVVRRERAELDGTLASLLHAEFVRWPAIRCQRAVERFSDRHWRWRIRVRWRIVVAAGGCKRGEHEKKRTKRSGLQH